MEWLKQWAHDWWQNFSGARYNDNTTQDEYLWDRRKIVEVHHVYHNKPKKDQPKNNEHHHRHKHHNRNHRKYPRRGDNIIHSR